MQNHRHLLALIVLTIAILACSLFDQLSMPESGEVTDAVITAIHSREVPEFTEMEDALE